MTSPTAVPRVLADLLASVADASPARGGALWRLAEPGRQLDANLVRLPPGAAVGEHAENDLDVLLLVIEGSGTLRGDAQEQPLGSGVLLWLPRTSRRALVAGPDGLAYLTVHRRRAALTIRSAGSAGSAGQAEEGGEDACWLGRVCPACGRMPDGTAPAYCSRCGERLGTD